MRACIQQQTSRTSLLLLIDGTDRQTDRRTPNHYIDPGPHTMWAASITVQECDARLCKLYVQLFCKQERVTADTIQTKRWQTWWWWRRIVIYIRSKLFSFTTVFSSMHLLQTLYVRQAYIITKPTTVHAIQEHNGFTWGKTTTPV